VFRPPRRLFLAAVGLLALMAGCAQQATGSPLSLQRADITTSSTSTTSSTTTVPPTTSAPVDLFSLRPPAPGADPAALADQISTSETTLRDPAADGEATAIAALAHQVAYRQLGSHPEWEHEVLARLPEPLRRVAELNAAARREFRSMHTTLATTMPAWNVIAPPPADTLLASYREAEATFGIPWRYLAAVNLVETGFGRIRGTSTAGAQGPMQFMPATWAAYGEGGDINDPHDAIMGAARYLAANNGAADIGGALYRYNHSAHYVLGVRIYADLIAEHPRAVLGYYDWGIWYTTDVGDLYLPVGYSESAPIPVADYLARG
jgi:membrane-bound lytic murein transglycosylase B